METKKTKKRKKSALGNAMLVAAAAPAIAKSATEAYAAHEENKYRSYHQEKSRNVNKNLMWVLITGIATVGGIVVYKKWDASRAARTAAEALKKVTEITVADAVTLTAAQATLLAEKLHAAMAGVGTNEQVIKDVIVNGNLQNGDIKLIVAAFGTKPYNVSGSPIWPFKGDELNLMDWFRKEVSGTLLADLRVIFARAGITL
jgi:hypothetical protein